MKLDAPPDALRVVFDMHGMVCEVRPQRTRPLWVQALYAVTAGVGMLAGVGVSGVVWTYALWSAQPLWFLGLLPVLAWWAALVWLFAFDRAQQLERLQVRVGEGWLVIRHHVANLLQEQAGKESDGELQRFVTETERVDLRECVSCRVVRGPVLVVLRRAAPAVQIPMRSHGLDEIGWLAGAIEQGIRDATLGAEPAPLALLDLRGARVPKAQSDRRDVGSA
ncbi:MAG: hypothetical protein R3F61_06530 [Myxococcota bacterium]